MDLGLRDRAVLVTGGTRGIGRAIAMAYAGEGARVATTYANDEGAANTVVQDIEAAGGMGLATRLDLSDPASIGSAIADTVERFGALDVLVANAVRWPIDARGPLSENDPDLWARALRANLEGTTTTVRAALPHLSSSSAGRVVLISSGVSRHGMA
jgi:3-oxoacyl-[acyl-carrier protein] reductase